MSIHVNDILFLEELPRECINDCSASGEQSENVRHWRKEIDFTVDRASAIRCLKGYGAWTQEELSEQCDEDLAEKVLWLACNDFAEYISECDANNIDPYADTPGYFKSNCGSDIFCLQ